MFEKETFTVRLTDPMLYDRLRTLSAEYDLAVESLVNVAVKRLIEDVDFVRSRGTALAPRSRKLPLPQMR